MPWFDHPSYRNVRDTLIARFKSRAIAFQSLKHVVFLCGGKDSPQRKQLLEYLRKWTSDTLIFQADDVWDLISGSAQPGVNALAMEEQLATLADVVIIIVQSPGTFAELGAFSISEPLRKKLLPIIEARFEHDRSFINTGPVRWVNVDSFFAPAIFAPHDPILAAANEIQDRLQRLPAPSKLRVSNLVTHSKHLLFFVRDILAVIGPVTAIHLGNYLSRILGNTPNQLESLLGLAESLRSRYQACDLVCGSRHHVHALC